MMENRRRIEMYAAGRTLSICTVKMELGVALDMPGYTLGRAWGMWGRCT